MLSPAAALARNHWCASIEHPELTVAIANTAPTIFFNKNNDQIEGSPQTRFALFFHASLFELVSSVFFQAL
jgi:hypothetical protein